MKEINNKSYLSVESKKDMKMVVVSLMDDGDWEYVRMGIGKVVSKKKEDRKVFVVDLDDSGEVWREIMFVKEGLSINDVLKIGCEVGVLVEIDWGYDKDDKFRVKMDEVVGGWDEFFKKVKEV